MKIFACLPLLFVGASALLADDVPLDRSFSFRLEEPTLRPSMPPALGTAPKSTAPMPSKTPERDGPPPHSTPYRFNGQTYYFILI